MKKSILFQFIMSLMLIFAVGCESSSSDGSEGGQEEAYTYSVVFQLTTLSDAYFEFGTLTLNYLNADGETKSIDVTADLIPGQVTVTDLSAGDNYSFELKFERLETLPSLTETSYQFAHYYFAYDQRSDDVVRQLVITDVGSTITIPAASIEEYVDKYTDTNIISFSGTVAE